MTTASHSDVLDELGAGAFALNTGAIHLFLAGVVNVASGAALGYYAYTDRLLAVVIRNVVWYLTEATTLRYGRLLAFLATDVAYLVSVLLVLAGVAACVVAWEGAFKRRSRSRSLATGLCNAWNPLTFPLAAIAIVLVGAARTEFATGGNRADANR